MIVVKVREARKARKVRACVQSVESLCGLTSNIKQTQIIETKVVNAGMLRLPIPVPVLGSFHLRCIYVMSQGFGVRGQGSNGGGGGGGSEGQSVGAG